MAEKTCRYCLTQTSAPSWGERHYCYGVQLEGEVRRLKRLLAMAADDLEAAGRTVTAECYREVVADTGATWAGQ